MITQDDNTAPVQEYKYDAKRAACLALGDAGKCNPISGKNRDLCVKLKTACDCQYEGMTKAIAGSNNFAYDVNKEQPCSWAPTKCTSQGQCEGRQKKDTKFCNPKTSSCSCLSSSMTKPADRAGDHPCKWARPCEPSITGVCEGKTVFDGSCKKEQSSCKCLAKKNVFKSDMCNWLEDCRTDTDGFCVETEKGVKSVCETQLEKCACLDLNPKNPKQAKCEWRKPCIESSAPGYICKQKRGKFKKQCQAITTNCACINARYDYSGQSLKAKRNPNQSSILCHTCNSNPNSPDFNTNPKINPHLRRFHVRLGERGPNYNRGRHPGPRKRAQSG